MHAGQMLVCLLAGISLHGSKLQNV